MHLWVTPCYILGVLQIVPPPPSPASHSLFLCSFLSLLVVSLVSDNQPFIRITPAKFVTISYFLTHLFYHRKEGAKGAECLLCSSLTRPPLCIHFTLLSEEDWQPSVGSQLRNFTGSTVRPLNLQPGVCLPHTLSHSAF